MYPCFKNVQLLILLIVVYLLSKIRFMIQRIQTLWLFLAGFTLFGLFLFPYLNYIDLVGLGKKVLVTGTYTSVNNESVKQDGFLLQTISAVIVGLFPLFIIMQFKNRKLQKQLIFGQIALTILLGIWMYVSASSILSNTSQFLNANNIGVGFFLLPVSILFLGLAFGGIRNDEKLIKSADRLRS